MGCKVITTALVCDRELLLEFRHVMLPEACLAEPRKRTWKRGVVPAPRQPRRVVNRPQGPEGHHQLDLRPFKGHELLVALEDFRELNAHLGGRAVGVALLH